MATNAELRARIPWVYQFLLLYFEPFMAVVGAVMLLFDTDQYFLSMHPNPPPMAENPAFRVFTTQLAATYFLFAFNQAVVLRLTSEVRVWRAMVFGMAICDAVHIYATGEALGFEALVNPAAWRWQDAVNLGMLYTPITLRLSLAAGVGVKPAGGKGVKRE